MRKSEFIVVCCVLICLLANQQVSAACFYIPGENPEAEIRSAVDESTEVVVGKVIGFEYRKGVHQPYLDLLETLGVERPREYETLVAKLKVLQRWKGMKESEIFIVTDEMRLPDNRRTGLVDGFHFSAGESYLIFASGKAEELRVSPCGRSRQLARAGDELKILGKLYQS
ncbi:MAG: hypothetical protein WBO10_17685 [Pyrinomonadaceae bacterium]